MFVTGDWLKDPALSKCSTATRGVWMDALCAMHESDRSGILEGTPEQLSRCLRTTPSEVLSAARELHVTGSADYTERNGVVTLINRRMQREHKERLQSSLRQKKARGKEPVTPLSRSMSRLCHGSVTAPPTVTPSAPSPPAPPLFSPTTPLISTSLPPIPASTHPPAAPAPSPSFERFWQAWPTHERKANKRHCLEVWHRLHLERHEAQILAAVLAWKVGHSWTKEGGAYIPAPLPWLRKAGWEALPSISEPAGRLPFETAQQINMRRSMENITQMMAQPANGGPKALPPSNGNGEHR